MWLIRYWHVMIHHECLKLQMRVRPQGSLSSCSRTTFFDRSLSFHFLNFALIVLHEISNEMSSSKSLEPEYGRIYLWVNMELLLANS